MSLQSLSRTDIDTELGCVPLWTSPGALASRKPLVFSITGAFAPSGAMSKVQSVVGQDWDTLLMHLPGNHTPVLRRTSVAAFARAADEVIAKTAAGRPVVVLGISIGALVAFGLSASAVRRIVAVEPPLTTGKLWPMIGPLQQKLKQNPDDAGLRDFADAVFGVRQDATEDRRYHELLEGVRVPVDVVLGDRPLFPQRDLERYPSLVDDAEREFMGRRSDVTLHVASAGHDVPYEAPAALQKVLVGACQAVLGQTLSMLLRHAPLTARQFAYDGRLSGLFAIGYAARNPTARVVGDKPSKASLDLVVIEDLAGQDERALAQAAAGLAPGGHLIAAVSDGMGLTPLAERLTALQLQPLRVHPDSHYGEVFDDQQTTWPQPPAPGPLVLVCRKGAEVPPPEPMRVETAIFAPALMDIRTRLPAQTMRSDPELLVACHRAPFDLPVLPPTAPKLLILQRPALVEAEGWRTWMQLAIRQGWIFVMEYDDHPELVAEVKGRTLTPTDWNRFGYVHAVQTSTETLARVFSAHNPEVKVFPNAVFDLAPFPKPLATPRIFYGAVTRGGFAVQVAASLGPAIADHPQAEFVVMADRAVFDALPTTRKTFVDYTPYGQYLQLMASCSISLSPIEARLHQDTKSDAKFLDAARSGVLTIASPTAYAGTIRHGETGLIAETVEDWAPMLQRALSDEPARAAMARAAWDYVREERMFACQLPQRKAWYRSLWERREALNAGVLARLPGLAGMLA